MGQDSLKVVFGNRATRNAAGKLGTSVHVHIPHTEGGWLGNYSFDTHGMSKADTAAKIEAVRIHHAKKCARYNAFGSVWLHQFSIAARMFIVVDCMLREMAGEIELYLDVREIINDEKREVDGFPIKQRFATIDDVPDNTAIVSMVHDAAQGTVNAERAHADYVVDAQAMIKP